MTCDRSNKQLFTALPTNENGSRKLVTKSQDIVMPTCHQEMLQRVWVVYLVMLRAVELMPLEASSKASLQITSQERSCHLLLESTLKH